jgi:hypothetical protein
MIRLDFDFQGRSHCHKRRCDHPQIYSGPASSSKNGVYRIVTICITGSTDHFFPLACRLVRCARRRSRRWDNHCGRSSWKLFGSSREDASKGYAFTPFRGRPALTPPRHPPNNHRRVVHKSLAKSCRIPHGHINPCKPQGQRLAPASRHDQPEFEDRFPVLIYPRPHRRRGRHAHHHPGRLECGFAGRADCEEGWRHDRGYRAGRRRGAQSEFYHESERTDEDRKGQDCAYPIPAEPA